MFFASLIGLLVSLTAFTAPASSLPINEVLRAPRHDGYLEDRAMETEYTPLPNRPTAAHLPKRTAMGPTRTEPHITTTAKPVDKRAGIDPEVYLTSIKSLWSAYFASSDSSLVTEISSFIENNQPTGIDTTAFQASYTSMMSGAGEKIEDFFRAAGSEIGDLFGGNSSGNSSANSTSLAGAVSTSGGTTYWSLPDYVSTWGGMNSSAQETWRSSNNYLGTYTDTPAASIPSGVARVDGPTTWWKSESYMVTMSSLASIDFGMAQVSWTKHNVFSGGNSSMPASTGSPAGLSVQMNSVAGASPSPDPSSVQSGNTVVSQASNGVGSSLVSSQLITNVMAGNVGITTGNVIPQFTTNEAGVTIIAGSQQTGVDGAATGLTPGTLASCPTSTGVNGVYVACNRGGDPALAMKATSSPVTSTGGTGIAAGQTSLPASSNCTLAACSAMAEPYTSLGVTST